MESQTKPRLYSLAEASAYLGIAHRTLWRLANSGLIPSVKFGTKVHLHADTVTRLERDGCPPCPTDGESK